MTPPAPDLIPIKSSTRTIQNCFSTCLYIVPNFQRPYSWTLDELEDYWTDVVLAQGDFFFGSTVTWESETRELFNNTYSIIDGQQRLTTSAIILSVIRDMFSEIAGSGDAEHGDASRSGSTDTATLASTQAKNTQKYLVIVDDDGRHYPVIQRNEPNFREVVQNPSAIPSNRPWNGSAKQIGVARTFFEQRAKTLIEGLSPVAALEKLKSLRNNVLKARIIQVELASEEDGFLIFETLNTRGADLRLADLVKNLLVRGGATNPVDRDTISARWDRMVDAIHQHSGSDSSADQFMWQSWNSRRPAVKEAELYKAIIESFDGQSDRHLTYLEELEFDALTYRHLDDAEISVDRRMLEGKSALKIPEVIDSFRALAIFNVSVANSALLALVRKYEKTAMLRKQDMIDACRAIENFHFQFTALTNSGSTGGTRARYNRFAVELEQASTLAETRTAIRDLKTKLLGSMPETDRSKEAFSSLFYAPDEKLTNAQKRRSRKIFISYVLLRMAQTDSVLTAGQDLRTWTIEHIRPQSQATAGLRSSEFSIGNLTLLTSGANGNLGDGIFAQKRSGLLSYAAWRDASMTVWLADESINEIDSSHIAERARALADLAIDETWSITP